MNYQRETMAQVLDEIKPLLVLHWEEITHFKDVPLDPDYTAYARAEQAGKLRIFTVRDDGVLIGYGIFFIGNLHYKSTPIATQDILFIHPKYRGRGGRLIRYCDEQLQADGIRIVMHHIKVAHNWSALLERFGYEEVDRIYARRIE
jgi:GNAT superfamily N-acetyltransferase